MTEDQRERDLRPRLLRDQLETGNIFGFLMVRRVELMTASSPWFQDIYGSRRSAADPRRNDSKFFRLSPDSHPLADRLDNPSYVTLVKPGIAIAGVANGPHSYFGGVKSS